jgi:hypothetical protein
VYANSEGTHPKLMMLSFLVKLADPMVNYRYIDISADREDTHTGKDCYSDDDDSNSQFSVFKNE